MDRPGFPANPANPGIPEYTDGLPEDLSTAGRMLILDTREF